MYSIGRLASFFLPIGLAVLLAGRPAPPDVLADFATAVNDPGYLQFEPGTPLYDGNLSLPEAVEGIRIETRTPSRLLFEDYVDPGTRRVRPAAVRATGAAFEATHQAHLYAFCVEERLEVYEEEPDEAPPLVGAVQDAEDALEQAAQQACEDVGPEIRDAWMADKDYAAYRFAEEHLAEAHRWAEALDAAGITIDRFNEPLPEVVGFLQSLFAALEVAEILRLEQAGLTERSNGLASLASIFRNYLKRHRIEAGRPEAANLPVPPHQQANYPNQRFLSPDQVAAYPGDAAALDPPNSGFWRKPTWAVSSFSTTDYHRLGRASIISHLDDDQFADDQAQVEALLDKDIPLRLEYDDEDLDGRTPKMTVQIAGQEWKLKYLTHRQDVGRRINPAKIFQKRWQGSEVNVEPVVNNLAAAIGYTVDPTYYQEVVHVYLDDDVYEGTAEEQAAEFEAAYEEMIEELTETYPNANIPSALEHIRTDPAGQRYIEVRGATLEKKSDPETDVNIGYFIRSGHGRSFKREFRAFSLFLAWVADPDIKDGNVKAKMVPVTEADGRGGYRLVYSASDMGAALGTGLPNLFPRDLVRGVELDFEGDAAKLDLTYRSIFPAPLLASVSFSDARWIARRIGQLTRAQITEAFHYAGAPEVVAQYYTELLLRRRDQLLEALHMIGTTVVDDAGNSVRLERLSRMHSPRHFNVEGYESYFRRGYLRDPDNTLHDSTRSHFPRYWGTQYPWVW